MDCLNDLLAIAGPPLGTVPSSNDTQRWRDRGPIFDSLFELLHRRNGFYAYDLALHMFPSGESSDGMSLERWNDRRLWIEEYPDVPNDAFFFAEDIFGDQFCITNGRVYSFDSETAAFELIAPTIHEWITMVLADPNVHTGWPLALEWQHRFGVIPPNTRLIPKVPFVLGGKFTSENLYAADAVQAMRFKADIACQIKDVPDGEQIVLQIGKPPKAVKGA